MILIHQYLLNEQIVVKGMLNKIQLILLLQMTKSYYQRIFSPHEYLLLCIQQSHTMNVQ